MSRLTIVERVGGWSAHLLTELQRPRGAARKAATPDGTPRPKRERGMALVIVLATIAILSVSVVEFVYNTRVNLYLAQNHRDEAKAYFLARSGVHMQMLTVGYQFEMYEQPLIGESMERSGFQLWRYQEYLLPSFTTGRIDAGLFGSVDLADAGAEGFGGVNGDIDFHPVVAEEGKINLNAFASREMNEEQLQSLCALLSPPVHDEMMSSMDQRDAAESRFEVIAAIIDHIDPDSDKTAIDENCIATVGGAGNESSRYTDVDWEAKNEPLVTLDEVLMAPGVTLPFLERFRDNLTVYPVANRVYINLADSQQIAGLLCANIQGAQTLGFSPCNDPSWAAAFGLQINALALAIEGYNNYFDNIFMVLGNVVGAGGMDDGMAGIVNAGEGRVSAFSSPRRFRVIMESLVQQPEVAWMLAGLADPRARQLFGFMQAQNTFPPFTVQFDYAAMERAISTDVPRIYNITATGTYGAASRTIRTVMDFREPNEPKIMYWREF